MKVYDYENGATDYASTLYRIAVDYESDHTALEALGKFLAHPDAGKAPGIVIGLYADRAPLHSENLLKLAREGFYDGTRFHRVLGFYPGPKTSWA